MKKLALVSLALIALAASSSAAVLITDFGNSGGDDFSVTYSDFGYTQSASSISLTGQEAYAIFGDTSSVDISLSMATLSLTGTYTGAYTGSFTVELFDINDNSRTYKGFFSSFTPSVSSVVTLAYEGQSGAFNGVTNRLGFTAGGTGVTSVILQATKLEANAAVPEPTTWALLAGGLTTVLVMRRRRK